ncbi:hypothetical protein TNCV_2277791 [Trichonephila clavipes]|nr:hypothetical protein TNCV_2277791 [Trichonephila clavipes]
MAQIRVVEAAAEQRAQLDLRMHVCESTAVTFCNTRDFSNLLSNKENTIGYKRLKDVNKKHRISLIIALHSGMNPAEDYSLSRHVLIGLYNDVCVLIARLKF